MYCARIDPEDFHSDSALLHTAECLEELAKSREFRRFVRHREYKERLYLVWFLAPLGLLGVFYYHLSVLGLDVDTLSSSPSLRTGEKLVNFSTLPYVTAFLLLYILPCIVIAPFCGFFEEPSTLDSVGMYIVFTVVNAAAVSWGGPLFDHPPYLYTSPVIPWTSLQIDWWSAIRVLLVRASPLQGLLTAGFTVSIWQRAFWGNAWHPPLPLLTIPILVGVWGLLSWRVASLSTPYFLHENKTSYSWSPHTSDKDGILAQWLSIAMEIWFMMKKDFVDYAASGKLFSATLAEPSTCLSAYTAAFQMALTYFTVLCMLPFVGYIVGGVLYVLPTHPTTWGLLLSASVSAAAYLMRLEDTPISFVFGVLGLIALLLYNGFVA